MSQPNCSEETASKQQESNSDDFLSFNDSNQNDFQPINSSSPQKSWEPKKNYKNNWNSNKYQGNNRSNFFYSPNNGQRNRSFNNSYQNRRNNRSFNSSNSFRSEGFDSSNNASRGETNIASYLHPSFMENPWERLERQLKQEETNNDSIVI